MTSTGLPRKSASETAFPLVSGNLKSGAGVPSGNMVEGVMAMSWNVAASASLLKFFECFGWSGFTFAATNNFTVAKSIVYFDLETQKSADEVGGWNNISKMGMSIGVTYNTALGEYKIYHEKSVNELITELQRADLVIGFNNLRFDYEVLHGYTSFDLTQLPTLDLMVDLQNKLNHRLSLDSIATA